MKRFIAAIIILLLIIAVSTYALIDMQNSLERIGSHTREVRKLVEEQDAKSAQKPCEQLMAEWDKMEPRLLLYVRHDHLPGGRQSRAAKYPGRRSQNDGASAGIHYPKLPYPFVKDQRPAGRVAKPADRCYSFLFGQGHSGSGAPLTVITTESASTAVLGRTVSPGAMLMPTTVPTSPPVSGLVSYKMVKVSCRSDRMRIT